jgi:hypothetical protein
VTLRSFSVPAGPSPASVEVVRSTVRSPRVSESAKSLTSSRYRFLRY